MRQYVVFVLFMGFLAGITAYGIHQAFPKNFEQVICDDESNPEQCRKIAEWYRDAKQPYSSLGHGRGTTSSCCGVGDAYWVDQIDRVTEFGIFATITDDRNIQGRVPRDGRHIFIPNEKLDDKHQGNPTGHNVVFLGGDSTRFKDDYPQQQGIEANFPYVFCAFLNFAG